MTDWADIPYWPSPETWSIDGVGLHLGWEIGSRYVEIELTMDGMFLMRHDRDNDRVKRTDKTILTGAQFCQSMMWLMGEEGAG